LFAGRISTLDQAAAAAQAAAHGGYPQHQAYYDYNAYYQQQQTSVAGRPDLTFLGLIHLALASPQY